ncbi:glycosyltransferase [Pediococcus parvulus]|uniref:glycosyltransferase n=1 Tax=Pediococcus parvulus TaxID=54062 RepID=UPI0007102D7D|nr:glycosyltransferase [Pediococcus parvulus]MCT3026921.1 glycosyltransferase [Pediococcus parvulus]GEL88995.1 putative glycosyltransferase WbbK [Pediococcus parvulus]GHC03392.1 putative glycosyltransferase WbbK [Pediococcus parvulus]
MKIVVNDIVAVPDGGGVFSILEDFYKKVVKNDSKNEWVFLLSGSYFEETDNVKILTFPEIKTNWLKRLTFEIITGKKVINLLKPDVYLSLQNTMTIGVASRRKIVYLHQPLSYQREISFSFFKKSERNLAVHQKIIGKFINWTLKKTQPEIIVQTGWMKREIIREKIATSTKVKIIKPKGFEREKSQKVKLTNSFFYPANIRSYKNHQVIFRAVKELNKIEKQNFSVFLTGEKNEFEKKYVSLKNVYFLGHISREEVFRRYAQSVLIFPSRMETFGLPLAEAKEVGTIIFAANLEYAHEVLGNYSNAYYFDAQNNSQLVDLMSKYLKGSLKKKQTSECKKTNNDNDLLEYILRRDPSE